MDRKRVKENGEFRKRKPLGFLRRGHSESGGNRRKFWAHRRRSSTGNLNLAALDDSLHSSKSVRFSKEVSVLETPSRYDYSQDECRRMYYSGREIQWKYAIAYSLVNRKMTPEQQDEFLNTELDLRGLENLAEDSSHRENTVVAIQAVLMEQKRFNKSSRWGSGNKKTKAKVNTDEKIATVYVRKCSPCLEEALERARVDERVAKDIHVENEKKNNRKLPAGVPPSSISPLDDDDDDDDEIPHDALLIKTAEDSPPPPPQSSSSNPISPLDDDDDDNEIPEGLGLGSFTKEEDEEEGPPPPSQSPPPLQISPLDDDDDDDEIPDGFQDAVVIQTENKNETPESSVEKHDGGNQ